LQLAPRNLFNNLCDSNREIAVALRPRGVELADEREAGPSAEPSDGRGEDVLWETLALRLLRYSGLKMFEYLRKEQCMRRRRREGGREEEEEEGGGGEEEGRGDMRVTARKGGGA
jgi:hypothetical protein